MFKELNCLIRRLLAVINIAGNKDSIRLMLIYRLKELFNPIGWSSSTN